MDDKTRVKSELSVPVELAVLRDDRETAFDISADEDARRALAARFGLVSIDRLEAHLSLAWLEPETVLAMKGRLSAAVVQTCVVSLEPVPGEIVEDIDIVFAREVDASADIVDPEEAEPLDGEILDIGEIVAEELSLALDPYPRHPDVDLSTLELGPGASISTEEESAAESHENNPFQVLEYLKSKL